ncbi:MAG: DsbA family protein [Hyphomicrobiales bacterium]|nr:MAG: DsbA family protein [Hyphomicrobiales bacterium]
MLIRSTLVTAIVLFLAAGPVHAETTPAQKQEIETIVRDYLLAHPEVIEEALNALQEHRQAELAAEQTEAIERNRSVIFGSVNQMVLGNPNGKVTLVEFFDYNCPYCKRAAADTKALLEKNPDLRIVMKEFPILSEGSLEAARISVAVKDIAPHRYLEFHEELFARPGQADSGKALRVARDLGLDTEALKSAAARPEVTENIQEVNKLANKLGIGGTPAYVIGNELIGGAPGYEVLQKKVTALIDCNKPVC